MKTAMRALPALIMGLGTALGAGSAGASAFQLLEQNASGLGNAYAGAAAVAEDASTIYFNPAGLTALPQGKNAVVAVNAINPSAKFSNSGTSRSGGGVSGGIPTDFGSSGTGGDAGSLAFVPNAYFSMQLAPQWTLGLGINAPFGLKTEYDDNWIGRFQGIKSEMKTMNINPTVAFKVNDVVSIGVGMDYQKIDATLTKAVNYTAVIASNPAYAAGLAAGNVEGRQELTGSDNAWGYNVGVTFNLSDRTRLGLAYRSAIKYTLTGTQTVTHPATASPTANLVINSYPNTLNQAVSLDLKVPDTFSMAVVQKLDDKWEMMGDLSWTGWSKIQEIRVKFTSPGATDDVTDWKLKDTWKLSLGANYRYADNMKFRFGVAYDQSPVPDQYRTVRLPDADRTWLSLGMQYKLDKQRALDVGFSYLWVKNAPINNNGMIPLSAIGYARGLTNGNYNNNVTILGAQYTANF
ncbi:MAG: outer membrane protein transport protein [Rhodocyclaceae bacterium]|nr:outer membrane protein transport protein [Rhodocyclaceae bacterium]